MYSVSGCVSNIESGHKLDIVFFLALGGYRFSVLVCRCMGGERPLDELKMKVKEEKRSQPLNFYYICSLYLQ